jgi:hypothetical protein
MTCPLVAVAGVLDMSTQFPDYPGIDGPGQIPLTAIIPFPPQPPPPGSSNNSLPVIDLGLLLNPPKTSVDFWAKTRILLLTTDAAWPSQEQIAAQVAAVGGRMHTSSSGLQVSWSG